MKITSVEIYDVKAPWRRGWNPVLVRVNTDEGISGVGEAGMAVGGGHSAYAAMVKDLAQMHLLGADPLASEQLWERMMRRTWLAQANGLVVYAGISAIDQALWDIRGKAFGLPVYRLLGGETRDSIRAYASQIHFNWPHDQNNPAVTPEQLAEAACRAVEEGFDAVKVDPVTYDEHGRAGGWDLTGRVSNARLDLIVRRMAAIRDAVGSNVDIILETHAQPGVTAAIQIGRAVEGLDIMYFEESVSAGSVEDMARVAREVRVPLAAGEHVATRRGFRPYFERQVLAVAQPDIGIAGGITETKKIADMAHAWDVAVQCHCVGSPVILAATLHVEAVIPNFIIHEYVGTTGRPENRALATPDIVVEKGRFRVPEAPGLGVVLDEKALAGYPCLRIG